METTGKCGKLLVNKAITKRFFFITFHLATANQGNQAIHISPQRSVTDWSLVLCE